MSTTTAPKTRKAALVTDHNSLPFAHPLATIFKCEPPLKRMTVPAHLRHGYVPGYLEAVTPFSASTAPAIDEDPPGGYAGGSVFHNGYHIGANGHQNLYRADLFGAKLRRMSFRGADLRYADLRGCDFVCSDLTGADLRGAHLADADFFLAREVALPAGWELVGGRARKKDGWKFDQRGKGYQGSAFNYEY